MAYDERLTERVLDILGAEPSLVQKKMFGGVAVMLQGNLACGVIRSDLIVRVPKDEYEAALAKPHVREMDFTGRPMRGWVVVGPEATDDDASLEDWVATGAAYALSLPPK
ncbi:MAG: TfoX/Sxy family protein [Chloroflexota bacterium]|nr:TfoX/Sxy family protein [Chloroflexota bacterium]MDE2886042.1 TfoX/Sxy family protein [Chloroflexota bacterium]